MPIKWAINFWILINSIANNNFPSGSGSVQSVQVEKNKIQRINVDIGKTKTKTTGCLEEVNPSDIGMFLHTFASGKGYGINYI